MTPIMCPSAVAAGPPEFPERESATAPAIIYFKVQFCKVSFLFREILSGLEITTLFPEIIPAAAVISSDAENVPELDLGATKLVDNTISVVKSLNTDDAICIEFIIFFPALAAPPDIKPVLTRKPVAAAHILGVISLLLKSVPTGAWHTIAIASLINTTRSFFASICDLQTSLAPKLDKVVINTVAAKICFIIKIPLQKVN